ncbi:OB-fold protein [Olleya aquimaris]|uniref:Putative nucleic acid binding protein n=1 Tax=Olleya aquimaris TaxID=639310 RepID=A0A327RL65_9FLAO|nr:hypothetical protein [Olleya aquimaris]RAJ16915.1 putative nucleic acid binding protein [Olleya aquimaris]
MKKKLLLLLGILAIGSVLAYNYIYQDHRNISEETAEYKVTSTNLVEDFIKDVSTTQDKYLNKTIEVTGIVTAKDANSVTLDNVIFCTLSNSSTVALHSNTTIKGRCIGFDDLLEEVKLDQCTIIK